jgi:2-polyprenyl-3-methyl-5-hydroxy-6-metoxy-1,4-benzoquinol methylase
MNNAIEQTEEYYDKRWSNTIALLPTGGDYRLDLRSRAWKIIADYIGKNKKVFEFATGVSHLPEYLRENSCIVKGCDFSQVAVDFAKEHGDFKKTDKIFGSGYDFITACQFIEHIKDPAKWIDEALDLAPIVIYGKTRYTRYV